MQRKHCNPRHRVSVAVALCSALALLHGAQAGAGDDSELCVNARISPTGQYIGQAYQQQSKRIEVAGSTVSVQDAVRNATGNEWQLKPLFAPTERQLAREAKGQVFIYYGLRDVDVERAMREEFDRIEHMMFAGTIVTTDGKPNKDAASGNWLREDDGCD